MAKSRYSRIIFTGQSGVRPHENSKNIQDFYTEFLNQKYQFNKIEDLIKEIFYREDNKRGTDSTWVRKFLQHTPEYILKTWNKALKKIKLKINTRTRYILAMHSIFYNTRTLEYIIPASEKELSKLRPQVFITLIDDIYDIHTRLRDEGHIFNPTEGGENSAIGAIFELIRILDWRAREIMVTRHFANELNADYYVIATKHNHEILRKLIETNQPTCYLSHPITIVRNYQSKDDNQAADKIIKEIHSFEKEISSKMTAFLPTTIDEKRIKSISKKDKKYSVPTLLKRWDEEIYVDHKNMMFEKPTPMRRRDPIWRGIKTKDTSQSTLLDILVKFIDNQIDVRDHILVEQSDVLAVYRPCYEGVLSKGVLEELTYFTAFKKKKKKCLIYLPSGDLQKLKIKQLEAFLEMQNKIGKIKKEKNNAIELTVLEGSNVNKFFGDVSKFDTLMCKIFNRLEINVPITDGTLVGDRSMRATILREDIIGEYFRIVNKIINTYNDAADKIISKITTHKKITNEILKLINN